MSLPYLAELPRRPILSIVAVVVSTLLALCSTTAAQESTDGALTVTAANTVLNQYAVLGANAAAGTTSFSVTNVADLSSSAYGALAPGDLVMLYQPQGASINTADNAGFGAVTNLNSAGRYEAITVGSVSGNTVTLDASCGALRYSYATTGNAQVVRIPQFTTLTISSGASVVASAWNGQRGGVVAVQAQSTVINGSVSASGLGFRGGAPDNASQSSGTDVALYRSSNAADGGEKGESIAGYGALYDTLGGRYGRGAPANGGGGGRLAQRRGRRRGQRQQRRDLERSGVKRLKCCLRVGLGTRPWQRLNDDRLRGRSRGIHLFKQQPRRPHIRAGSYRLGRQPTP